MQYLKIGGLCQIIVRSQAAAGKFTVAVAESGEEDERDGGVVA
jgi:hypothetical protein